ncbi:mechanosensitive ion channel family protein [Pseudoflavonifractor phocaeensis]|uniref:mechanosensitive ion channel family protein n=1 Tax=Pseudoflavonifractor phocaeensis TaxID=1870988 RepID=UPI00195D55E3|nr:mechanosensitive ion channel family protein [Pseudoflavonifractor phocaeensis]MBM6924370.1 mechanosensitive ion channel family protein [Pseudoflavonifractor phocaeensis]
MLTNLTNLTPEDAEETIQTVTGFFNDLNLKKIVTIVVLFAACMVAMKVILRLVDKTFQRMEIEKGLHTFIHAALRVILWLITICIVLDYVGVPMTSLVAVLSVLGLAVSLAIQGTLSNLAGGIQVLVSQPFKAGDYVEAGGVGGTVVEVGLAYTKLATVDNKVISVPNGQISSEKITNYTTAQNRRVDLKFDADYSHPLEQVVNCIRRVVEEHPKVLSDPEPFVRTSAYKDSSIEYTVRAWCATEDYWDVYYDLVEQVKYAFDREGIQIPFGRLDVHIIDPK